MFAVYDVAAAADVVVVPFGGVAATHIDAAEAAYEVMWKDVAVAPLAFVVASVEHAAAAVVAVIVADLYDLYWM